MNEWYCDSHGLLTNQVWCLLEPIVLYSGWEAAAYPGLHFPRSLAAGLDHVTREDKWNLRISHALPLPGQGVKYQAFDHPHSLSALLLPCSLLAGWCQGDLKAIRQRSHKIPLETIHPKAYTPDFPRARTALLLSKAVKTLRLFNHLSEFISFL